MWLVFLCMFENEPYIASLKLAFCASFHILYVLYYEGN
jgi:hypothetical protein